MLRRRGADAAAVMYDDTYGWQPSRCAASLPEGAPKSIRGSENAGEGGTSAVACAP